jgi:outer membrane protein assembly factor BamB
MKMNNLNNNDIYDFKVPHPVKYTGVLNVEVESKSNYMSALEIEGDELYLAQGELMICIDLMSKSIKWVKKQEDESSELTYITQNESDYIYSYGEDILFCSKTGLDERQYSLEGEYLIKFLDDVIVTSSFDPEIVSVRDSVNFHRIWSVELQNNSGVTTLSDKEVLILGGLNSMFAFKLYTGELLWKIEIKPWIMQRFPEEVELYYSEPSRPRSYPVRFSYGPLHDGIQYLCCCGHITALNVLTGNELWSWKMPPDPEFPIMTVPSAPPMIKDAKLYVLQSYSGKGNHRIFCLDAKTGDFIYQSDHGLFDVDSIRGFMAGNEIIVAKKGKVIAYDIDERKVSWQFDSGDTTFDGYVLPYHNGLIVIWSEFKKVFWYEAE